jgi:hypothetical protein
MGLSGLTRANILKQRMLKCLCKAFEIVFFVYIA